MGEDSEGTRRKVCFGVNLKLLYSGESSVLIFTAETCTEGDAHLEHMEQQSGAAPAAQSGMAMPSMHTDLQSLLKPARASRATGPIQVPC